MKDKVTIVTADWKDIDGLANAFKKAIRKLGAHIYNHPDFEGSDTYGFIVSDKKLSRKKIKDNYCIPKEEIDYIYPIGA